MTSLLGPDGQPISSETYAAGRGRPKKVAPVMGEAFGNWAGRTELSNLPGLEAIQFDVTRLTIADFRKMGEHYQINSSLLVLSFMLHQLDWHIKCDDPKIEEQVTANMTSIWTRLVRSMCSSFQFGFSPNVLQWENGAKYIELTKVKDLLHEECRVNWKEVDGPPTPDGVPRKFKVFNGIYQWGYGEIPAENSFWYPLLMQYGDMGGRKLLRTAFQPWFFSSLIHLYQNRYFERFGEPVPIGRAPYDDKITVGNKEVSGSDLMTTILGMIRNRSAVVLPNDTTRNGTSTQDRYDYTVEYLESQMRGADFERYLTRLDEEMSLALFTPLLLLRTADGGGFNQGVAHTQVYLWMLNAIAEDWKEYIDKYVIAPMALYNFGPKAKLPTIHFRKLGTAQQETIRAIIQALIQKDKIMPDIEELGQHAGLDLREISILSGTDPTGTDQPQGDTGQPQKDKRVGRPERLKPNGEKGVDNPRQTTKQITQRIAAQVNRAYRENKFGPGFAPTAGFARQLAASLESIGYVAAEDAAMGFVGGVEAMVADAAALGVEHWSSASEFNEYVTQLVTVETDKLYES